LKVPADDPADDGADADDDPADVGTTGPPTIYPVQTPR